MCQSSLLCRTGTKLTTALKLVRAHPTVSVVSIRGKSQSPKVKEARNPRFFGMSRMPPRLEQSQRISARVVVVRMQCALSLWLFKTWKSVSYQINEYSLHFELGRARFYLRRRTCFSIGCLRDRQGETLVEVLERREPYHERRCLPDRLLCPTE